MIFVMGSSDPNGRLIFAKQKDIVKEIVDIPYHSDVRFGVVQYDSYPSVPVRLGYIRDKDNLKQSINTMTWRRNGITLVHALRRAADQFVKEGRSNANSVLIVFTNGNQIASEIELSQVGAMLRKQGITVRVITTDGSTKNVLRPLVPKDFDVVAVNLTDPVSNVVITTITNGLLAGKCII